MTIQESDRTNMAGGESRMEKLILAIQDLQTMRTEDSISRTVK